MHSSFEVNGDCNKQIDGNVKDVRPIEETEAAWVTDYFGDEYLRLYQFPPERTGPEVEFLVNELTQRIPPTDRFWIWHAARVAMPFRWRSMVSG